MPGRAFGAFGRPLGLGRTVLGGSALAGSALGSSALGRAVPEAAAGLRARCRPWLAASTLALSADIKSIAGAPSFSDGSVVTSWPAILASISVCSLPFIVGSQGRRDGHERCTMISISHRAALPRSGRSGQSLVRYGPGLWSSRDRPPGASTGGRLSQPRFPALGSDLSGAPKETGRRWDN